MPHTAKLFIQPAGSIFLVTTIIHSKTPHNNRSLSLSCAILSFLRRIFPFKIFVAMHAAHLAPYLAFSGALALKQSRHDPYHTGSRAWPLMQRWANKYMTLMADLWLGGSKVIYDGPGDRIRLPATCDRVIYGFHPHGLYPVAAGLLPFFPAFERVAPEGPRPITLTADAMYFPPVLRDVMGWSGARRSV